jgi:hypothetical protein
MFLEQKKGPQVNKHNPAQQIDGGMDGEARTGSSKSYSCFVSGDL